MMTVISKKSIFIATVLFLLTTFILAHEYVLLGPQYELKKGDQLILHLFVSDGFNIELERPLQKNMTRRFELLTSKGSTNLLTESADNSFPILNRQVDFEGTALVHMERDYAKITLTNDKFLEYLKEDHIEGIKIDQSKPEQRERYSRYIKCLVVSQKVNSTDTLHRARLGHAFEFILLENPYLLKKGDKLRVQVFFKGKPLANKIITARNRTGNLPATKQTARTDDNGICSFRLNRKGEWFIHATHMIPCPEPSQADWESFWASYSFGIKRNEF